MRRIARMVDMALKAEDKDKGAIMAAPPGYEPNEPAYPYGLCLSLGTEELAKLDLDDECDVGDMIHLFCLARVTSKSKREMKEGADCRIELQITHLGLEDEGEEDEESY